MSLRRLFEAVIEEAANEEKPVYKGGDPNSLAAWLYVDVSPTTDGRIQVTDEIGKFEWDQIGKLNDIFESVGIPDRLNPENRILLVVDTIKEGSTITIISATLSNERKHQK